jgi:hypothetical protein
MTPIRTGTSSPWSKTSVKIEEKMVQQCSCEIIFPFSKRKEVRYIYFLRYGPYFMHEFSEFNLSELLFNNFEVFYLICFVGGVFKMAFFLRR